MNLDYANTRTELDFENVVDLQEDLAYTKIVSFDYFLNINYST